MHEFFRGWRRKVGCATLVFACLLMGAWVRSRIYVDSVMIYRDQHASWFLISSNRGIKWIGAYDSEGIWSGLPFAWYMHSEKMLDKTIPSPQPGSINRPDRPEKDEALWPAFYGQDMVWNQHWQMFGFCIGDANLGSPRVYIRQIPYWSVVVPLTLLSSFLVLRPSQSEIRRRSHA